MASSHPVLPNSSPCLPAGLSAVSCTFFNKPELKHCEVCQTAKGGGNGQSSAYVVAGAIRESSSPALGIINPLDMTSMSPLSSSSASPGGIRRTRSGREIKPFNKDRLDEDSNKPSAATFWECSYCPHTNNPPDALACTVCSTAKPGKGMILCQEMFRCHGFYHLTAMWFDPPTFQEGKDQGRDLRTWTSPSSPAPAAPSTTTSPVNFVRSAKSPWVLTWIMPHPVRLPPVDSGMWRGSKPTNDQMRRMGLVGSLRPSWPSGNHPAICSCALLVTTTARGAQMY